VDRVNHKARLQVAFLQANVGANSCQKQHAASVSSYKKYSKICGEWQQKLQ
jgi:hypothetical protein